jgi:hypothetical protein
MMRERLTYANVVSTLCLFILLGGGAYAAVKLPKNSVGTKQIKKNAVTGVKVKPDTLGGSDINEATLGAVPRAGDANRSAEASNAQTLGGMSAAQLADAAKVRCPGGTTAAAGICFESSARASAALGVAMQVCGKADRRLPNMGELMTFGFNTFSEQPPSEWVEPEYVTSEGLKGAVVQAWSPDQFAFSYVGVAEAHAYRCVAEASN